MYEGDISNLERKVSYDINFVDTIRGGNYPSIQALKLSQNHLKCLNFMVLAYTHTQGHRLRDGVIFLYSFGSEAGRQKVYSRLHHRETD